VRAALGDDSRAHARSTARRCVLALPRQGSDDPVRKAPEEQLARLAPTRRRARRCSCKSTVSCPARRLSPYRRRAPATKAPGRVHNFRFGPTEHEPTSGSRLDRPCRAGRRPPLLFGDQRSHAVAADCPLEDDRLRTQAATPSASGDTRANTNAGVGPAFTRDMLVARSSTLRRTRSSSWGLSAAAEQRCQRSQCTPHAPRTATGTVIALIPQSRKRRICSTFLQWSQPGSNRRPPACKAGALPTELWPLCCRV
jgi:hypothetical protein